MIWIIIIVVVVAFAAAVYYELTHTPNDKNFK